MHHAAHPNKRVRALAIVTFVTASVLALSSCSRQIGVGVVLWSPDEDALASGSVVPVVSQSDLTDTYTVELPVEGESLEMARWRVQFFEDEEEANSFGESYQEYAPLYARATRNALPMRSNPALEDNNIIYRLRDGEVIKIIDREEEQADLSGLRSYWYTALTETGVRAYVFGYELDIFNPTDPSVVIEQSGTTDPLIEMLLENVWRPVYFVDMITNGTYDLDVFQPEFGLFPDPEEKKLELVLPYHSTTFEYDAITRVGPRKYLAEGTTAQLTFNRGDELSLQYLLDGRQYILALQRVPGDIGEYVEAELERRSNVYEDLMNRGPIFSSGSYGRITLLPEQRFTWTGFDRLVPAAIPAGTGQSGSVHLDLYLSAELMEDYDGALSLQFEGREERVNFIYALTPDGIRMVYVPQSSIDDNLVLPDGVSAITLFFSATGG